jgi:predicted ATPase
MKFSRLVLKNWRNFSNVEVDLEDRMFLIGPNASGKSNFLDVLRFLRDLASVGGGIQEAVRRRGGISKIRCLAARHISDILIDVTMSDSSTRWRYVLMFNQDSKRRPIIRKESVYRNECQVLDRPDDQDKNDAERKTQTSLEQVQANKDFREVADFVASVRYLHLVPQLIREPDRSIGRHKDPYGSDFLDQVAKQNKRKRRSWLSRISKALKVAVPQLKNLEFVQDMRGVPHLRGLYEHWRPQGAWQEEDQFSDGTLRLIGLLWSLIEGSGPLLLEEPELSLHPEVVRFIPQMIARLQNKNPRQILISTHSTDLLRDEGIGAHEVLILIPSEEGTEVKSAKSSDEIKSLIAGGLSMAEAAFPKTQPPNAHQLSLFGE